MRICVVSDTHNSVLKSLEPADVYVHCGDATLKGSKLELDKFFEWYGALPGTKLYVPGNHDAGMAYGERPPENITMLVDQGCTIQGVRFWGMPWVPVYGNYAFMLNDRLRESHIEMIPKCDVLITHGPGRYLAQNHHNTFCGDLILAERVRQIRPVLHCFGHIHESHGEIWHYDDTISANASWVLGRRAYYYELN